MLALTEPLYSNYFASKYHVQFQNLNTIKVYFRNEFENWFCTDCLLFPFIV